MSPCTTEPTDTLVHYKKKLHCAILTAHIRSVRVTMATIQKKDAKDLADLRVFCTPDYRNAGFRNVYAHH
jgi:hypothetical protein